ncbi:hypothetical protein KZP23_07525 [Echinicola marina]|uniref:hypothetical protein n=1 Tax=Echinicola marina TaxID=2859768 RepID=UPI001CF63C4A|nr:hypothetical protein [Echinicola marina]UCS94850.1 hypothetical protein KZP23_07525 [Echinicola marina]
MNDNIRKAAIQAIKEGDISRLKALKRMIGQGNDIPVYFQLYGHEQIYNTKGEEVLNEADQVEDMKIEGVLPQVSSIVVVFPDRKDMEASIREIEPENETLKKWD